MDFVGEKIYKCGDSLSKIYKCGEVVWSADTTPDYYLYLTVLRYVLPYEPDTFEVEVFTNLPEVQAIIPVDWLSMTGREDNFYYFSTDTNSKPEERNTTLTFTDTMGLGLSASCQVIQLGMPCEEMPLTFEILSGGTLTWAHPGLSQIQYQKNNGEWTPTAVDDTYYQSFEVEAGDIMRFKSTGNTVWYDKSSNGGVCHFITGTEEGSPDPNLKLIIYGNINSLVDKDNFAYITDLTQIREQETGHSYFYWLFNYLAPAILDVSNLQLPATILTPRCYRALFKGCENITVAPNLPAERIDQRSYYEMFSGCTNLHHIKCMAKYGMGGTNTQNWVQGVSSTGTFIKHPNATEWSSGSNGIPEGWTVIEE